MTGSEWFRTSPGGLPRYFSDLFSALSRRPDVVVTARAFGEPDDDGDSWGSELLGTVGRVRAARLPTPPDTDILDRHFALYGAKPSADGHLVTHFHGPWALESAASGEPGAAVAAKRILEIARYRRSARFVVLSKPFADVLVGHYRINGNSIAVIPPGVNLERFSATTIPDGPPRVLCVRRLERRMGIDVLLAAWPNVLAAVPEARLDIVGDGSLAADLQHQIDDLDVGGSVTLLGQTTDAQLEDAYRAATTTVVPTRALEGFGLIALESLASGRAPVVTDVGGLPDAVRGLAPNLVVPPEDPDALATRLAGALLGDRPSVAECRAHAETFGWDTAAAQHVALYEQVAQ